MEFDGEGFENGLSKMRKIVNDDREFVFNDEVTVQSFMKLLLSSCEYVLDGYFVVNMRDVMKKALVVNPSSVIKGRDYVERLFTDSVMRFACMKQIPSNNKMWIGRYTMDRDFYLRLYTHLDEERRVYVRSHMFDIFNLDGCISGETDEEDDVITNLCNGDLDDHIRILERYYATGVEGKIERSTETGSKRKRNESDGDTGDLLVSKICKEIDGYMTKRLGEFEKEMRVDIENLRNEIRDSFTDLKDSITQVRAPSLHTVSTPPNPLGTDVTATPGYDFDAAEAEAFSHRQDRLRELRYQQIREIEDLEKLNMNELVSYREILNASSTLRSEQVDGMVMEMQRLQQMNVTVMKERHTAEMQRATEIESA